MNDRTRALAISPEVKRAVADRDKAGDWPCCIYCGSPAPTDRPTAYSCAHYIARSQGGLGIVENILTLCPACHREYDSTTSRNEMRQYFKAYLEHKHPGWDEKALVYKQEDA